jgi:protein phosphatase
MGGHAAGEVASAAAISALSRLDEGAPGTDLLDALADAVNDANHTLHNMVVADPSFEGMGTTLTAMLWSDGRALCHIGDSRAYLLRNGEFHQITHDHTLVQTLVDEGRITPDDVATHPQRSMLLRALDGRADVEPDLTLLEARLGDRYLLCSDGLSGVVSEETLHRTLATVANLDEVVLQLVELAIRGGGPDNITCIVADVVDSATTALPPSDASVMAGAASNGSGGPHFRTDSPAGRPTCSPDRPAGLRWRSPTTIPAPQAPEEPEDEYHRRRGLPLVKSALVILIILVVGGPTRAGGTPRPSTRGLGRRPGRHLPRHQPERRRDQPVQRGQPVRHPGGRAARRHGRRRAGHHPVGSRPGLAPRASWPTSGRTTRGATPPSWPCRSGRRPHRKRSRRRSRTRPSPPT